MNVISAGILLYKEPEDVQNGEPEIFLIRANHVSENVELWGIPKGRVEKDEALFLAAKREFSEENCFPT